MGIHKSPDCSQFALRPPGYKIFLNSYEICPGHKFKMSTVVGILTYMTRTNVTIVGILTFMTRTKFMSQLLIF